MQSCPSEEAIEAFVSGQLPAQPRQAMEAHFSRCARCERLLMSLLARSEPALRETVTLARRPSAARTTARQGDHFGRYVLLEEVGAGGQGRVHAAYDTVLDRKVALKFLAHDRGESAVDRLLAEAGAMAKLSHPNVVTVFDAGVIEGEPFIAMDFINGTTLAAWRKERANEEASGKAAVTWREVATLMAGAARGLAAAHAAGIVHRDVKPHNILIDGKRALVTDFGLSHTERGGQAGVVGTPAYMAPEQFDDGPVDARTDVFGFCATLYQTFYGVLPFAADNVAEMYREAIAGRVRPAPAGVKVPARLHQLIRRGLSPKPSDRPATMELIAEALLADPEARRWRIGGALTGGVALAAAFWGGLAIKGTPERRCHAGAAALASSWSQPRRAEIAAHFAAGGFADGWSRLGARIDDYAQTWRRMHGETCDASFVDHRQSDAALDLGLLCLERRRGTLATFLASLPRATPAQMESAPSADLPDLGACSLEARAGTAPLPADPGKRAEVLAVQTELANADADVLLGDYARAEQTFNAALTTARRIGYQPLWAEAAFKAGKMAFRRRADVAAANPMGGVRALFQEAMSAAERGAADLQRAEVYPLLVHTYVMIDRFDQAALWGDLGRALLTRLGDPPSQLSDLELALGNLNSAIDRREEARAAFSRALELRRQVSYKDGTQALSPMTQLCAFEATPGARISCLRKTLAFAEPLLGKRHPRLFFIYDGLAEELVENPRSRSEACAIWQKARELAEGAVAVRDSQVLSARSNVLLCEVAAGNLELGPALEALEVELANGSSGRAFVRAARAHIDLEKAQYARAERRQRQVTAVLRALLGAQAPTHNEVVGSRVDTAETLLAAGQPARALEELDAALAPLAPDARLKQLPRLHSFRGQALLALRRFDAAEAAFKASVAAHDRLQTFAGARSEALAGLGLVAHARGARDVAIAHLEQAFTLGASGEVQAVDQARVALTLAQVLLSKPRGPGPIEVRGCQLLREATTGLRLAPARYARDLAHALALERRLGRRVCPRQLALR